MVDVLEVFFLKIGGGDVFYRCYTVPWPDKSVDPNGIVNQSWADIVNQPLEKMHEHCICHSSSWRWEDGVDTKTYLVYSERFDFTRENAFWIALNDPRFTVEETERHEKTVCSFEDVLAHTAMHLAFLVQERDGDGIYTQKLAPETIERLKAMRPASAGRLASSVLS